jgi:hypothetical protein
VSVEYGIVTSVVPPGNWHYQQALSTGQTIKISAFSFEDLLKDMLEFRRRHMDLCGAQSATIEKVREDLKLYLCAHFKQNCADSPGAAYASTATPGIGVKTDYQRPIDRAGAWIAEIGNIRTEKVDYALAGVRAQTCAQCPQNVRWATPCAPCNDNILVRIQQANGSLYTPLDKRLHMCRVFGHLNAVAVWLTDTHSTSDQPPPANCWKAQNNG